MSKPKKVPHCQECEKPLVCMECDDPCERNHCDDGECEGSEEAHCDDGECLPDSEVRTCGRVECDFQWLFTGEYLECPMCALREAKARIEVLTLEVTTARAA